MCAEILLKQVDTFLNFKEKLHKLWKKFMQQYNIPKCFIYWYSIENTGDCDVTQQKKHGIVDTKLQL